MQLRPMTACGAEFDAAYYEQLGPAASWMSRNRGNWRMRNGVDDDGDGMTDECGDDMDGIESWWGLCHAWVPAAILEEEPIHAVDYNGAHFEVSDITALLITAYDRTDALMLGGRCNARTVERDANGRPLADECRDSNPGAVHVILTNFLGINQRAFAMDRTYDFQVWNQPVVGYDVRLLEERTASEAMRVLGVESETYTFNSRATSFYEVRVDVQWITESSASVHPTIPTIERQTRTDRWHYVLEVDARGKIIGGEWAADSREHPDFLWLPVRARGGNPHVRLDQVRTLLELSRRADEPSVPTTGGTTIANDVAVAIPDNDPNGVTSTLQGPEGAMVGGITVHVDIAHTYRGDLRVVLEHAGRSATLHDRAGGSARDLDITAALAQFDGTSQGGAWTLRVTDTAAQDTGTIRAWSVSFHGAQTGGGTTPTTSGPRNFTSPASGVAIPDNDPTGAIATVRVPSAMTIRTLAVAVDVQHTYVGDLVVTLEHAGRAVTLQSREGGANDDLVRQFAVTDWNGQSAAGDWTLRVADRAAADTGSIRSFSITVE